MFGRIKPADRIVACVIVRGELLFGISRLPEGGRRAELEQMGHAILATFFREAIPEAAADFYAAVKLERRSQGLASDENDLWVAATALALPATLVTRDLGNPRQGFYRGS